MVTFPRCLLRTYFINMQSMQYVMNMDQFVNQNDNLVDWAFLLIAVCLIGLAFYVTASSTSYIGVKFCDYICKTACLQLQNMQANTLENFLSHQTIRRISFCAWEPGTGHMPVVQQKACICLGAMIQLIFPLLQ